MRSALALFLLLILDIQNGVLELSERCSLEWLREKISNHFSSGGPGEMIADFFTHCGAIIDLDFPAADTIGDEVVSNIDASGPFAA